GDVYMVSRNTIRDGQRQYLQKYFPTSAASGRLRITRAGEEAALYAAEGPAGDFRELCRYPLGREDVKTVWLTAYTRHTRHAVDLRVVDLRVRSDSGAPEPGPDAADAGTSPPPSGSRLWRPLAVLILLAIVLALGMWLYARRRGGKVPARDPGNSP